MGGKPLILRKEMDKSIINGLAQCRKCRFCVIECPLYEVSGSWMSPINKVQSAYYLYKYDLKPDNDFLNVLYYCSTCANCEALCKRVSAGVRVVELVEAVRAYLVNAGVGPLIEQRIWGNNIIEEHNPYMEKHANRTDWLPSKIKIKLPKKAEYCYFVGCTSSYRQKNIARATVEILMKAGLDFTILEDEWCCGSPLLRTGQWDHFKEIAHHNVEVINRTGADKVITSCAGCFRVWKIDCATTYNNLIDIDIDFKTIHTTELLEELIEKGELNFASKYSRRVTYHDPCHLGRHAGVYKAPRKVMEAIPGLELVEMPRIKEEARCCGSGGGFKSGFRKAALEVAWSRVQEAIETGAEVLSSSCPFCWRGFYDAIKAHKAKIKLLDVVEIANNILQPYT